MKERPILFNAEMVRAILAGRKTMTRRAVKLKTGDTFDEHALVAAIQEWRPMYDEVAGRVVGKQAALVRCPYGKPGDRLWVREAHAFVPRTAYARSEGVQQTINPHCHNQDIAAIYRQGWERSTGGFRWRPSIHMPRWASRILLEVVSVRVERLQEISEADALAEGITIPTDESGNLLIDVSSKHSPAPFLAAPQDVTRAALARALYAALWESINGTGSWAANPWVWVVEFRVIGPSEVAA